MNMTNISNYAFWLQTHNYVNFTCLFYTINLM